MDMTLYELVSSIRPAIHAIHTQVGGVPDLVQLRLYEDWIAMRKDKQAKKMYIYTVLSDKYRVSERMIQRIIKRMESEITISPHS